MRLGKIEGAIMHVMWMAEQPFSICTLFTIWFLG